MAVINIYDEPNNTLIQVMYVYMSSQFSILCACTAVTATAFICDICCCMNCHVSLVVKLSCFILQKAHEMGVLGGRGGVCVEYLEIKRNK